MPGFVRCPGRVFALLREKSGCVALEGLFFFLALTQFMMVITGRKRCLKDLLSAALIIRPAAFLSVDAILVLRKHG